jgi:hypothetical protein
MEGPPPVFGFKQVFSGFTQNGSLQISDLAGVADTANEWVSSIGTTAFRSVSPEIMVFLTYANSQGTFFKQESLPLTDLGNQSGGTYALSGRFVGEGTLDLSGKPMIPAGATKLHQSGSAGTSISSAVWPFPNPPGPNEFYEWGLDGNEMVAPSSPTQIPVALVSTSTNAYGILSFAMFDSETAGLTDGLASAANLFQSGQASLSYGTGGQVISSQYWENLTSIAPNTGAALTYNIWVMGQVGGQEFQEYYCQIWDSHTNVCLQWVATNVFQFDTAIINVQTKGSYVIAGVSQGWPSSQVDSNITHNFTEQLYASQTGTGNQVNPSFSVTDEQLVDHWGVTPDDLGWASTAVNVGMVLTSLIPKAIGALGAVAGLVVPNIDGAVQGYSISKLYYDGVSGYPVDLWAYVSNANYRLSNGQTASIPLMFTHIEAGGGGGGCVPSGTLITLFNRTQIPVQSVSVGASILSYDRATGKLIKGTVTAVNESTTTELIGFNNGSLYASGFDDQPLYVMEPNGTAAWLVLSQIHPGMELYEPVTHTWVLITSMQRYTGNFTVYEIESSPASDNDYIANGFLADRKLN